MCNKKNDITDDPTCKNKTCGMHEECMLILQQRITPNIITLSSLFNVTGLYST